MSVNIRRFGLLLKLKKKMKFKTSCAGSVAIDLANHFLNFSPERTKLLPILDRRRRFLEDWAGRPSDTDNFKGICDIRPLSNQTEILNSYTNRLLVMV